MTVFEVGIFSLHCGLAAEECRIHPFTDAPVCRTIAVWPRIAPSRWAPVPKVACVGRARGGGGDKSLTKKIKMVWKVTTPIREGKKKEINMKKRSKRSCV